MKNLTDRELLDVIGAAMKAVVARFEAKREPGEPWSEARPRPSGIAETGRAEGDSPDDVQQAPAGPARVGGDPPVLRRHWSV